MQITLPQVSIGAYGRVLKDLSDNSVAERFFQHSTRVDELKRELAAEIARKDIAWNTFQQRVNSR